MDEMSDGGASKYKIPVIDRMMDVLAQLERRTGGATIRELTALLALPRTTIYRIVNTLQGHDMVRRDDSGAYHLGHRLLALASHVATGANEIDLAAVAQPFLDKLSADIGEGSKLSVIDQDGILVLAAAQGRRQYALTVAPGQRMPIHAGAASKMLLAHLPPEELAAWLAKPLIAYTSKSQTDPKRLMSELTRIKRLGWAQDRGENAPSIQAFAAPVLDKTGRVVAAISVPYLAGAEPSRMEEIRLAAIDAARAMSEAMPV
ncbi:MULTISPECIES: IclR family transcriptional regulator [Neorhizobium]|jgi:DNA-binding IclR family transcriptional regulator|uniref:IclR family transcriptional regulator n=1 Tax=Neorhizobium sp. T6_25 TaxID=2093833 RepID=UPI001FE1EDBC|nr:MULTISPECIES: IclR family transcriptional regulator [Neorhizobium]